MGFLDYTYTAEDDKLSCHLPDYVEKIPKDDATGPAVFHRNVIINYLPSNLCEEELYDMLAAVIPVAQVKIIRKRNGNSKGFGFACFHNRKDAETAIRCFNGYIVGNKRLKLTWSRPKKRQGCNLCIQNLPRHWEYTDLYDFFRPFGMLLNCRVLKKNKRRGYRATGFVLFDDPNDAKMANDALNGIVPLDGNCPIRIEIAYRDSMFNKNSQGPAVKMPTASQYSSSSEREDVTQGPALGRSAQQQPFRRTYSPEPSADVNDYALQQFPYDMNLFSTEGIPSYLH